ncbi:hypothetical protein SAMN04488059_10970 [Devosia psychrophila]|uniref:Uncharacterized protein n=1 Tax=Devosia psychrophila TaxID=728005 RepID=A0A1I1LBE5_9HYPH|nr:hypothetical protein SAMN04488059_10970 [Devosia psychrophila]
MRTISDNHRPNSFPSSGGGEVGVPNKDSSPMGATPTNKKAPDHSGALYYSLGVKFSATPLMQ